MKVAVYQSYRTRHVPAWIEACMGSVKSWAAASGFDYHFMGDELFALAPDWFRAKAGAEICPVTDLARLVAAKNLMARGYDLTIWVDADVLVFKPGNMKLVLTQGFAFCHEIWASADESGAAKIQHRVNNSVTVFSRHNVHLDFFIDSGLQIANQLTVLGKLDIGTHFLSKLRHILPFPLIENVGMFSPPIMADIAQGEQRFLPALAKELPLPLACANLCASLQDQPIPGFSTDAAIYEAVVEACLSSGGDVINRFIQKAQASAGWVGAGSPTRSS